MPGVDCDLWLRPATGFGALTAALFFPRQELHAQTAQVAAARAEAAAMQDWGGGSCDCGATIGTLPPFFTWLWGVGAPPILVYFSGGWDVHWGYGILTHGHMEPDVKGGVLEARFPLKGTPKRQVPC